MAKDVLVCTINRPLVRRFFSRTSTSILRMRLHRAMALRVSALLIQNKLIRHVVCTGPLGRVEPNPRVVPLNEL